MPSDHELTDQETAAGGDSLGIIVAALIVIATLATVVLLVAR